MIPWAIQVGKCSIVQYRSFTVVSRLVLGIESSCDDSCAAIVSDKGVVLASAQMSQEKHNQMNRGIIPSEAARVHGRNLPMVISKVLESVNQEIDAVALTIGPGLAPCLGEGLKFAQQFCKAEKKSLILVNHMEAHAMAASMNSVKYPSIAFLVSGGNTETLLCNNESTPFLKLGNTLDDACGECMDKVFRFIYESQHHLFDESTVIKHGGAQIAQWASEYEKRMNETFGEEEWIKRNRIPFPSPLSKTTTCDFSFSGIKTHSTRYLSRQMEGKPLSINHVTQFCFYFQQALVKHLTTKLETAILTCPSVQSICCGGGVMSNIELQRRICELGEKHALEVYVSPKEICTDNAIMIAWRGQQLLSQGKDMIPYWNVDDVRYNDKLDFALYSI